MGLASGTIVVHNLKFDEEFVRFRQSEWGPVTALSFRTDRTDILVSGSSGNGPEDSAGHVAIWDLNDRKLTGQIRDAHQGPVTGLQCLPGEPILVTSSPDNTVKQVRVSNAVLTCICNCILFHTWVLGNNFSVRLLYFTRIIKNIEKYFYILQIMQMITLIRWDS